MRVDNGGSYRISTKLEGLNSNDDVDILIQFNEMPKKSNSSEMHNGVSVQKLEDYMTHTAKYLLFNDHDSSFYNKISKLIIREKQQRDLLEKHLALLEIQKQALLEIQQKSHIKGWLANMLPEDWRGELEALRYNWLTNEKQRKFWIEILTVFYFLDMLKAWLQIKIENKWLLKRKQS